MDDEAEEIALDVPEEEPAQDEPEPSGAQSPPDNGTRTPSLKTDNGTRSPSVKSKSDNGTKSPSIKIDNGKTPSIKSDNGKTPSIRSGNGRTPSARSDRTEEIAEEEKSKSEEEIRKSEEVSLDEKPASLDELCKDQKMKAKIYRQCHRRFREIIGKREMKNEELERQQGDLKHRLNMLECSMPAVMVWNIWRMAQGNCVPNLKRVMEKQFLGPAAGEVYCPSTPSRHFDCRVREIEAERKQAQKRAEEARALWSEKMSLLEERSKRLEEVKRIQEETKLKIEQLTVEAKKLRESAKAEDDGSCETGECGVIECKKKWLEKVPSNESIKSADIVCLDKLQELAQNEYCIKRHIADLECREEAYMRTLQQADELWCKLESDAASTVSALQEQVDMKTAANQQMADKIVALEDVIEQLRAKLGICAGELEKYMSKSKIDALIGSDDDWAEIIDKAVEMSTVGLDKMVGDESSLVDRDMLAAADMADADMQIRPDMGDAMLGIHPEDFAYEDERLQEARAYLDRLGVFSLSELDKYPDDLVCAPDFICNDVVLTETGLTEEEMQALKEGRVTARMLLEQIGVPVDQELAQEAAGVERVEREMRSEVYEETTRAAEERMEAAGAAGEAEATIEKSLDELRDEALPADDTTTTYEEDTTDLEDFGEAPAGAAADEEAVSAVKVATEPSLGLSAEEAYADTVVVPRSEMLDWQDDVDKVRSVIAECPDCVVVKKDADNLADRMAYYTGTYGKELPDRPREPREAAVAVEAMPEVEEAEVTVAPSVEEAEVTVAPSVEEAEVTVAPSVEEAEVMVAPSVEEQIVYAAVEQREVAVEPSEELPVEVSPVESLPLGVPSVEAPPSGVPLAEASSVEVPLAEASSVEMPLGVAAPLGVPPTEAPSVELPLGVAPPLEVRPTEAPSVELPPTKAPPTGAPPGEAPPPGVPPAEAPSVEMPPAEASSVEMPLGVAPPLGVPPTEAPSVEMPPAEASSAEMPLGVAPPLGVPPTEAPSEVSAAVAPPGVPPGEAPSIEIPALPPGEEPVEVEGVPLPAVEEEAAVVPVDVEIPVEGEVVVPVEGIPEEGEVEMDVEVLPEEEEVPVEVEEVPLEVSLVEVPSEEVPPEELPPEEVPVEELPPGEVPVEELPPGEVPVEELPPEEVPVEELPPEEVPVEVPVEELPPEEVPVEIPVEELPPEEVPVEVPVEELPPEEVPVEVPVEELPPEEVPVEVPVEELPPEEVPVKIREEVPPEEEEEEIPCTCISPPRPARKMEITQTEITRIETVQVVTQTVIDVDTQTSHPQITRHVQPPVTTVTRAVDPDSESIKRLLAFAKPLREQQATASTAYVQSVRSHVSFQMKKSTHAPLSEILKSLMSETSRDPEQEIRSIDYGKPDKRKPGGPEEGKCNCCQCGKMMAKPQSQTSSMFRTPSKKSSTKSASPSRDPGSQVDCTCADCKLRKLRDVLRSQHRPTKDQQICACVPKTSRPSVKSEPRASVKSEPRSSVKSEPRPKSKEKVDQSCMAKIARAKAREQRSKRCEDKVREEVEDVVGCACSGMIEQPGKPGKFKRVHCACGDPD